MEVVVEDSWRAYQVGIREENGAHDQVILE